MKKATSAITVLVLLFALGFSALAQDQPRSRQIVTQTRLQVLFSDLESQWLKAVQDKDEATLNRILAEDFEVWTPGPPGDPVPRDDWLKEAFASKLQSFRLRQMAVRPASPEISIASFVLSETLDRAGQPRTQNHFVVDVWTKSGERDNWRCTDRYISVVSGATHSGGKDDAKPTGRD